MCSCKEEELDACQEKEDSKETRGLFSPALFRTSSSLQPSEAQKNKLGHLSRTNICNLTPCALYPAAIRRKTSSSSSGPGGLPFDVSVVLLVLNQPPPPEGGTGSGVSRWRI